MSAIGAFSAAHDSRRAFLKGVGDGLVALTAAGIVPGAREARAQGLAYRNLSQAEGTALEALGDVLLPGAAEAGIAHYVDDQLASREPLLILKYVDYPEAYAAFYREGLAGLDGAARARHGLPFHALDGKAATALVGEMAQHPPAGWSGPPSQLFYFVTRSDAVDVFYGTQDGFARLDIPYMPHIAPTKAW